MIAPVGTEFALQRSIPSHKLLIVRPGIAAPSRAA
jgi:hypothetical protein